MDPTALITDPPVTDQVVASTAPPVGAPITIADGSTVELNDVSAGQVTFNGPVGTGILQLDRSTDFNGTVAGMIGQDMIDLRDINFAAIQKSAFSGSETSGTLSLSDGIHTANIQLLGNYIAAAFSTSGDGHGGTSVEAQPHPPTMITTPLHV
jgi:hypothetical protein